MASQKQLFPKEIFENTLEVYLPTITIRSQITYTTVLAFVIICVACLPFFKINISIQSRGIVRTVSEKTELRSISNGIITTVNVLENKQVNKEEVLYTLQTGIIDTKLRLNASQQLNKTLQVNDLLVLTGLDSSRILLPITLSTTLYAQEYNQFLKELSENPQHQAKIKKELDADTYLYQEKVISMREFDEKKFTYHKLLAEFKTSFERQMTVWQADLSTIKIQLTELEAEHKQFLQEKNQFTIKASVAGTLQQVSGKYIGGTIQAGELLAIISPDSNLLIECYVTPKDIGLIRQNGDINFQIDAFNYNEWGIIKGKVKEIASDFTVVEGKPVFKILVTVNFPLYLCCSYT